MTINIIVVRQGCRLVKRTKVALSAPIAGARRCRMVLSVMGCDRFYLRMRQVVSKELNTTAMCMNTRTSVPVQNLSIATLHL